MTEEDLKNWFLDKVKSCYIITYSDDSNFVYLSYDNSFLRHKKLNIINKTHLSFTPKINKGIILFDLDIVHHFLYCNYDIIWLYLKKELISDAKIQDFIIKLFKGTKLYCYTPVYFRNANDIDMNSNLIVKSLDINSIL